MIVWFAWFLVIICLFWADYLRKDLLFSRWSESFFYYALLFVAIVFAGFRYQIGNDYDAYVGQYNLMAADPRQTYMEPGFAWLCHGLAAIGISAQGMLFLIAAITLVLVGATLKKYSVHPALSLMIFLLLPAYYFNMLGIVRQFLVISVVFALLPLVVGRKFWKFVCCILLLAFIHKSVILMVPFYFVANVRLHALTWISLLVLIIIIPVSAITQYAWLFGDYDQYLDSKSPEFGLGITLILRVVVFLFVAFSRERFTERADRVIVNFYMAGVIFYFATLGTEAVSRISLYLTIFEVIVLVNVFYLYTRRDRIRMGSAYVMYCALLFFQNLNSYSRLYKKGTSEGNIRYEVNFKLVERP